MDAAPFVSYDEGEGKIGRAHGLVGGPNDVKWAVRMVGNSRDRFGARGIVF